MREEKKYEILPGVEIPDIKKIQEAASDFSISEVGDVELKTITIQPVAKAVTPAVSSADLNNLQSLGDKVAEDEERSKAESRAKMDKIMNKAVQAPESIFDLKASHMAQVNEEKRKQIEEDMKEADAQKAEEEAKNKAREERRQLQQRMLEESREKAAREKEAKEKAAAEAAAREEEEIKKAAEEMAKKLMAPAEEKSEEAPKAEAEKKPEETPDAEAEKKPEEAPKTEAEKKPEETAKRPAAPDEVQIEKKTASVASNSDAFEDFKEFLDDLDNE